MKNIDQAQGDKPQGKPTERISDTVTPEDQIYGEDNRTDNIKHTGRKREHPAPGLDQIGNDPTIGDSESLFR